MIRIASAFRNTVALALSAAIVIGQTPAPPATPPAQTPAPAPAVAAPQTPAPQPPAPAASAPGYNLKNASLLDVIDILARDLHINYILDSRVKGGTVTINTYGEVKATDLRPIFETILRMNQLALVQVGNIFRIVPSSEVSHLPVSPQTNLKEFPENEQMILNLVFLKYMTAAEMENILKPFLGESATMVTYTPANLLMIEDNARNMRRTFELINIFDSDQFAGQRVQLYNTQFSRPSDLVKELDTIFKAYALNEKNSAVKFLAIDRINTVLAVAANAGIFTNVADWIKKLDVPARAPAGAVDNYFYKLKYGRAEILGGVISQLYGGTGFNPGSSPFSQAGQRFNNTGFQSGGVGGGLSGGYGGGAYGGGGYGGGFGGNFGGGAVPYSSGFPSNALPSATAAPVPPSAMAGAFGAPGAAPGTNPAAGAPGSTPDQTGSYLSTGVSGFGGLPRIVPNPFDNSLLVQGTPQQWAQILKLLEQLDIAPRQVLIDAKIYEVDLNDSLAYGVEAYLNKVGVTSGGISSRQLLGSFGQTGVGLTAGMLVGQSRQLLGALTASDLKTRTKVISAPSIIATDSIPASINVGSTVPTLAAQAVSPGLTNGGTSQFTQSIQNQNTGVTLNILARVNASGVVTMVIDQSVSAPQPNTTSGIDSPSFSQREISTQVTVQDGDTVAIGGIIQENNQLSHGGIPGLNRIPYVGGIFGNTSYAKQRTELIIFLTPRVIYDTNQIEDASDELKDKVRNLMKIVKQ